MRTPVSAPQNIWFDGRNVDDVALQLEQNYNNQIQSSIINNHLGSGVLLQTLSPNIIFNSASAVGLLDGKVLTPTGQPSDPNYGNQLQVTLTGSQAADKRTVKVLVIGLDFQNNLQYDRFVFKRNEAQLTSKHYRTVLAVLFNDLLGVQGQSLNLGGAVVISEANTLQLSRDCIDISQDTQPNIFFRDFFVTGATNIGKLLTAALPSYNIDNLNIQTGYLQLQQLLENDVSSQVGEKFLASSNNIQKITLLMSVSNTSNASNLVWTGDIIVSVYALQSTVSCPTDIAPNLAIEFDPSNIPLAQLSFNYNDLLNQGVQLNTVPQPVDFVFSNTAIGSGMVITPGSYYAVTVKRAGTANTCEINFAVGTNSNSYYRSTLFNGSVWTDIPEQSLWFQVWTDAAKVSDGQAYDAGHGIEVAKTQVSTTTGATVDYYLGHIPFTRNDIYYALVQADSQDSALIQDERTGDNVNSEQQYVPNLSLLNTASLASIQSVSQPLIIGTISDQNNKNGNNTVVSASFHQYGFTQNQVVIKVVTDGYGYDQNIIAMVSELVEGNLTGAKFIPDVANANVFYRIAEAELLTMIYGDVNGDGVVDANDLLLAQSMVDLNVNLNVFPTYAQYIQNSVFFVSATNVVWKLIDKNNNVLLTGTDGVITPNPSNGAIANFNSLSSNFHSIADLTGTSIVISNAVNYQNDGSFLVVSLIDNQDITIQRQHYTSDFIMQAFRADIDGDMVVDSIDYSYIENYVNLVPPFPATVPPANKVGTTFQVVRFTLEEFIDRADDYTANPNARATTIHPVPDIFLDGYGFFGGLNVSVSPLPFSIVEQLAWSEADVVVTANPRLVPAAFNYQSSPPPNACAVEGIVDDVIPSAQPFDPGRNDFFVPNNLVLGGQIVLPDGYSFKVDLEICPVVFQVPPVNFGSEVSVNLLTDFIADYTGAGYTRIGYPAMKFADCSNVGINAFLNNQVRLSVSLQSYSPQLNGIDGYCLSGVIVDNKIGIAVDYSTGMLTLNFANLYQDPVLQTLDTKVQVMVYLKKAGWTNQPIFIQSLRTQNLLEIIPNTPTGICQEPSVIFNS